MKHPKITVVTASLNQGAYLEATITSVLDQGYPNLEYMVFDGGSTDNTLEIIKRHASHLTYWRSARDDGQSAALKEGFERATGDVLAWLNSDDLLAPGALKVVAAAWAHHGPGLMIAGGCQVFGEQVQTAVHLPRFQSRFGHPEPLPVQQMLDMVGHWFPGDFFYQPEVFLPRQAYNAVGGIDASIYYTMDYDLWMRLALYGLNVVVVPDLLALYREHPLQKTANIAALHKQMVDTANLYLGHHDLKMSRVMRKLLAISNRLGVRPTSRRALSVMRQLIRANAG